MEWCRLHADTLNDPKVQRLPAEIFKIWINSLCLATTIDRGGNLGTIDEVCFAFRETKKTVSLAFHALQKADLIVTVNETFQIKNWNKRQYKSDTSTERVKRHRKRFRNVTVTAPDTDTEQIQNKPPISPFEASITFEEFWRMFPRQVGRGEAVPAYKRALEITTHETIMAALRKQLPRLAIEKFPEPTPAKWLNAERWADGDPVASKSAGGYSRSNPQVCF